MARSCGARSAPRGCPSTHGPQAGIRESRGCSAVWGGGCLRGVRQERGGRTAQSEGPPCDGPVKPGLPEVPALSWNVLHTPISLCPQRRQPHEGHALGQGALQQSLTLEEPVPAGSLLTAVPTAGQRTLRREIWEDGGAG